MLILLYIYSSLIFALSPPSLANNHPQIHKEQDILSCIPCKDSFYREGLLYFLKSSSIQDFNNRVKKWCTRFDIPTDFDQRWTHLWYGKEKVMPFEDIKTRWKEDYGLEDTLNIFDEMRTRHTEAVSRYASSYSENQKISPATSYEKCLRYLLQSSSIEDYNRRIETCYQNFNIPKSERSMACISQKHYDITEVIEDLHREWQKIIQDKIPDHINNDRSRSIETLLMFGALSCMSFDTEPLKTEILKKMQSSPQVSLSSIASLGSQTKKALKEEGFIGNNDSWNERQVYLMTSYQENDLRSRCDPQVIASLYSQSFFYLLREIAKRGSSDTTPPDMREEFISELEIYMVKLHSGKEEAFLREKSQRTLYFLDISSLAHYDIYLESVHHFYQKMKRLKPQLKALSHKNESYRTEEEFQELWTSLLEGKRGLCPAGAIERPLFSLEEFYDWSNVSSENELFLNMIEHYYAHIVEKIAGLDVLLNHISEANEAHARIHIHNILSQGSHRYFSEVDKQESDVYALSGHFYTAQDIQRHCESLLTPFHFGVYVLEFFQDKRFLKIFAQLKKLRQREDLFMDDHYQSFRIDRLILCLGEGFISFNSPKILRRQVWVGAIREHQFYQLRDILQNLSSEEKKIYWRETIGIQRSCLEYVLKEAENSDIEHLKDELKREIITFSTQQKEDLLKQALCSQDQILINRLIWILGKEYIQEIIHGNFLEFLYHCLHYGSLEVLECFLMSTTDLQKRNIKFQVVLDTCLKHGQRGLNILKYLINNAIVSLPKAPFTKTGVSFLSHIIESTQNEQVIMLFLIYFIEELKVSPRLIDKNEFAFTPLHWACLTGHLSVVKYFIEKHNFSPNYCDEGTQSALSQAAQKGHFHILKYLIEEHGASPTLTDKTKFALTPLHWACRKGHVAIIEWLIKKYNISPDYCDEGKQSALNQAAATGNIEALQYLIEEHRASPTLTDKNEFAFTPLHWACQNGHLNIVKYLIEQHKVPPNYRRKGKESERGQDEPLTLTDKNKLALTPLHWACYNGHLNIVKYLIEEHQVSPGYCDEGKISVLNQATKKGHLHILQYLIEECGVSPTLTDKNEFAFTPLHWACQNGHLSIVRWLVEKKRVTLDFERAINIAMQNNQILIVEYFVCECGVQVIEEIETFLVKHKRINTLQKLREISNISNFLEQGYNPFLSAHRFNQLHEAIRRNKLSSSLWAKLDRWSHHFVHNTEKYAKILTLGVWDRLLFWNKGHLNQLNSALIIRSS